MKEIMVWTCSVRKTENECRNVVGGTKYRGVSEILKLIFNETDIEIFKGRC
jgi:hypothetical protein